MPLNIPPIQWPKIYNMVNLGGIDLATANGSRVPGIYQKITAALTSDHIEVFYNWKFADIVLPPSKVIIDTSVVNQYIINEEILIKSDDTVGIIGFIRIPIIVPLTAEENAVYGIPTGVDGFGPVTVQVPIPMPTLVGLNVDENGTYTPESGIDGFNEVVVNVPIPPPTLVSLNADENGTYTPEVGIDGFSKVIVSVPPPVIENPYIVPDYYGFSYGYIATGSDYYCNSTKNTCASYFHVEPGKYVMFLGDVHSNRYRAHFYANKTYEDFRDYCDNPHPTSVVYHATYNITGTTEVTDYDKRFIYVAESSGEIIITTSNQGELAKPYLFKLTN